MNFLTYKHMQVFSLLIFITFYSFTEDQFEEGLEYLLFEEIPNVITATQSEINALLAPSNITIISAEKIKSSGAKRLTEVLDFVPGFLMETSAINRKTIFLRGIVDLVANDKIKLLFNGHAVSEPISGSWSDYFNIGLNNIRQIEIIRGPGSALYGTNAFGGVINIITYTPQELNSLQIDASTGTLNTQQVAINYGKELDNGVGLGFNFNYFNTDGNTYFIKNDSISGSAQSLTPTESDDQTETETSMQIQIKGDNWSINGSYMNTVLDNVNVLRIISENTPKAKKDFWYLEGTYNVFYSDDLTLDLKVSYDSYSSETKGQRWPRNFTIPFDINGDGITEFWPDGGFINFGADNMVFNVESRLSYQFNEKNKTLAGIFYEKTGINNSYFSSDAHPVFSFKLPSIVKFEDDDSWIKNENRDILGGFLQHEWLFKEDLYLILGARFDKYSDFGSTLNPRVGIIWKYNNQGNIKLLHGSAFKAPSLFQLYTINNVVILGNPDLDAETIDTSEIILNHVFLNRLYFQIAAYNSRINDVIQPATVPGNSAFMYLNSGSFEVSGIEIDTKYSWRYRNYIYINYNFVDISDPLQIPSGRLPIPKDMYTIGVNLNFRENWNFHVHVDIETYLEEDRPQDSTNGIIPTEPTFSADSTTKTVSATLRYETLNRWDFYVTGLNIFEEKEKEARILFGTTAKF